NYNIMVICKIYKVTSCFIYNLIHALSLKNNLTFLTLTYLPCHSAFYLTDSTIKITYKNNFTLLTEKIYILTSSLKSPFIYFFYFWKDTWCQINYSNKNFLLEIGRAHV